MFIVAKKQKHMLSSEKRIKTSKKIRKSDDIIVVAKLPIEEVIIQTTTAKEINGALRKIKDNIEVKIQKTKEKTNNKSGELYSQARRLIANVYSNPLKIKKLDYETLYSYLESKETSSDYEEIVRKLEELQTDELGEKEIVQEDELMNYLRKFMLNQFVGQDMNDISVEQKERMNYYVLFNKQWVMIKIPLLGLGEKTYHAPRD